MNTDPITIVEVVSVALISVGLGIEVFLKRHITGSALTVAGNSALAVTEYMRGYLWLSVMFAVWAAAIAGLAVRAARKGGAR